MDTKRKRTAQLAWFMIVFFILWTLRVTLTYGIDESIASPMLRTVYSNFVRFLVWVMPAATFVYILRDASPVKYLGLSVWPKRGNLLLCMIVTGMYLLVVAILKLTVSKKYFSVAFLSSIPITLWLIQLLVPPLIEELLFRGFLVTELRVLMPLSLTLFMTGILFACIHVPFWVASGANTHAVLISGCNTAVFGALMGWLFVKTGSIWPSTFAHIAANLLPQFFV